MLEDFLLSPDRPDVGFGKGAGAFTQEDVDNIRKTWIGLWPMDNSEAGQEGYRLAMTQSSRFVLKPQREGGGNNIYRSDIPQELKRLEQQQHQQQQYGARDVMPREAYILMELITPPDGVGNWLVRGGDNKARKADVVSELGVFGVALFGPEGSTGGNEGQPRVVNREAGFLMRTKGRESDEGGVAIGRFFSLYGLLGLL